MTENSAGGCLGCIVNFILPTDYCNYLLLTIGTCLLVNPWYDYTNTQVKRRMIREFAAISVAAKVRNKTVFV